MPQSPSAVAPVPVTEQPPSPGVVRQPITTETPSAPPTTETPAVESKPAIAPPQADAVPNAPDAMTLLRQAADAKDANLDARKILVAALIASGNAEGLVEADHRLRALQGVAGVSPQWLRLQRAALADAAGELAGLESAARDTWLAALRDMALEIRGAHVTDGERKDGVFAVRDSISYRPDDYVSVAFEARYFGVAEREGRFDYGFTVSARLLDADGTAVADFAPPAHTYKGTLDYPAHRFNWFEFVLRQRLPRDLAAGNYTVELTLADEKGKQALGMPAVNVAIRVR